MKKTISALMLICFCVTAKAQSYGSFGDTLIWLHAAAINNYVGMPLRMIKKDTTTVYLLPDMLGADEVESWQSDTHGMMIRITYLKSNNNAKKAKKDLDAFFKAYTKDGVHNLNIDHEEYQSIEENGRDIITYIYYPQKEDKEFMFIDIYQDLPVLVDESTYQGKFPAKVINSSRPQVMEIVNNNGPGSYTRYNGIFRDGVLIKGNKVIHGFGSFYDGTWFSENWAPKNSWDVQEVTFYPEGTNDKVYGEIPREGKLNSFKPGTRYQAYGKHSYSGFSLSSPKWIRTAYVNHFMAEYDAKILAQERYNEEHPGTNVYSPSEADKEYNARKAANDSKWSVCSCCHGLGYTETRVSGNAYAYKDRYGNYQSGSGALRTTCSCCQGTGR